LDLAKQGDEAQTTNCHGNDAAAAFSVLEVVPKRQQAEQDEDQAGRVLKDLEDFSHKACPRAYTLV
jgi:hypothetical protein